MVATSDSVLIRGMNLRATLATSSNPSTSVTRYALKGINGVFLRLESGSTLWKVPAIAVKWVRAGSGHRWPARPTGAHEFDACDVDLKLFLYDISENSSVDEEGLSIVDCSVSSGLSGPILVLESPVPPESLWWRLLLIPSSVRHQLWRRKRRGYCGWWAGKTERMTRDQIMYA